MGDSQRSDCGAINNSYVCTLEPGHKGQHTAHTSSGHAVHTWRLEGCWCAFTPPAGGHNASCPHSVTPGDLESVLAYLDA